MTEDIVDLYHKSGIAPAMKAIRAGDMCNVISTMAFYSKHHAVLNAILKELRSEEIAHCEYCVDCLSILIESDDYETFERLLAAPVQIPPDSRVFISLRRLDRRRFMDFIISVIDEGNAFSFIIAQLTYPNMGTDVLNYLFAACASLSDRFDSVSGFIRDRFPHFHARVEDLRSLGPKSAFKQN